MPQQYTVGDAANFYDVNPLYRAGIQGRGQTIGIMTLANFNTADAYSYWSDIGLRVQSNRITKILVDGGTPVAAQVGDDETSLDVEQSGGLAPQAKIRVYIAPNTNSGFLDLFYTAASENVADTVSISWGEAEEFYFASFNDGVDETSQLNVIDQALLESAAQGQSVFAASGDSGAYDLNDPATGLVFSHTLSVDSPSNDPYITAAGGTTVPTTLKSATHPNCPAIVITAEQVWGWDYLNNDWLTCHNYVPDQFFPTGGGGGVSSVWSIPFYQHFVSGMQQTQPGQDMIYYPNAPSTDGSQDLGTLPAGFAGRNVPDLSLNADPETGYILVDCTDFPPTATDSSCAATGYGGTSFVAPQLNGMTALIDQAAGGRVGLLNPMIYPLQQLSGLLRFQKPFNDITAGDNWFYTGVHGYDDGSGIGTLNVANLAFAYLIFELDRLDDEPQASSRSCREEAPAGSVLPSRLPLESEAVQSKRLSGLLATLWLTVAASASMAGEPFVPTPSQLYGPLFIQVQTQALRPGNDNFVDDIPKASPLVIMQQYRAAKPQSREALLRFVEDNFIFPVRVRTPPIPADRTVAAHIQRIWPLLTRAAIVPPAYSSLLYVPKPYVVPGGAFQEFYYWDSYFTMLGLIPDGHADLARDLVDDFSYLIETYGHIPNGARTFYLSRSQPPVYYLMVGLLNRDDPAEGVGQPSPGPRARVRLLDAGSRGTSPGTEPAQCRRNAGRLDPQPLLGRPRHPRDEGYHNDVLTARASGMPPATGLPRYPRGRRKRLGFQLPLVRRPEEHADHPHHRIVPVDLNSLLYGLEEAIARGCGEEHDRACAQDFESRAHRRQQAMDRYLWDGGAGTSRTTTGDAVEAGMSSVRRRSIRSSSGLRPRARRRGSPMWFDRNCSRAAAS